MIYWCSYLDLLCLSTETKAFKIEINDKPGPKMLRQ